MRMSKRKEAALVPILRFSEFRCDGEWVKKELNQALTSISNGLSLEQIDNKKGYAITRIETISDQTINKDKVGYIQTEQDISSYKLHIGDILFSNINSLAHVGKVAIIDKDYDLYHGMNLLRLQVDKKANSPQFIFYLLNTESLKTSFRSRANQAVNQASINQTELGKTNIIIPSEKEQQKIADCLSSLDELIAAENKKLALLKMRKKGLMQKLFPAEGKTIPELRFESYTGTWKQRRLGEILSEKVSNGIMNRYGRSKLNAKHINVVNLYTPSKIQPNELAYFDATNSDIKKCNVEVGDIFLTRSSLKPEGIAQANILLDDGAYVFDDHIIRLKLKSEFEPFFVKEALNHSSIKKEFIAKAKTGTMTTIGQDDITSSKIIFPSKSEQARIGTFFRNIDEIIASQAEKIETLKLHKKGLMQGLFPSAQEVFG